MDAPRFATFDKTNIHWVAAVEQEATLKSAANTKVSNEKTEHPRPPRPRSSLQKLRPHGSPGTADEDRRQVDDLPRPFARPPRRTRSILRARTCGSRDFTADAVPDLKNLERDGMVIRELFPEVPPASSTKLQTSERACSAPRKDWSIGLRQTGSRSGNRKLNTRRDSLWYLPTTTAGVSCDHRSIIPCKSRTIRRE